jgi:prevent-host-death family protein
MNVAVRTLKNELSACLRRVRRGERLVVTDRGRPVAEVCPVRIEQLTAPERMARLVDEGMVTAPRGTGFRRVRPAKLRGRLMSATVLEGRR